MTGKFSSSDSISRLHIHTYYAGKARQKSTETSGPRSVSSFTPGADLKRYCMRPIAHTKRGASTLAFQPRLPSVTLGLVGKGVITERTCEDNEKINFMIEKKGSVTYSLFVFYFKQEQIVFYT